MRPLAQEILSHMPPDASGVTPPEGHDDAELEAVLATLKTTIKVIGCGGGGCNTINRLTEQGLTGTVTIACNTDAQHLLTVHADRKILLGRRLTRGLGAGALPDVGERAAQEASDDLKGVLANSDMVFITLGLGGGTGTGSAPIVAEIAKASGSDPLTIAVATLPFTSEGLMRTEYAVAGLERLSSVVDTVITIPNDRLLELVPRLPVQTAFKVADSVLASAIRGITEVITRPGLVNLDFNDLRTILRGGGVALIGMGESESDNRAEDAVMEAINSPLLRVDIAGATGALINVTGGPDMTVSEAQKASEVVQRTISPNARIIWGANIDPTMQATIRVMLVVTGVKSPQILGASSAGSRAQREHEHEIETVR
ncbi:MAG: cell division protein FtsZ [Thermoplasmata archaeon]|jgi:cell division protein FtsZ